MPAASVRLAAPDRGLLPAYRAALEDGWGPHFLYPERIRLAHLAAIAADADGFLAGLSDWRPLTGDPPLHRLTRWILKDGAFAGIAVLRWPPAGQDLPREAWGHLGLYVLPGLRAKGLGRTALRLACEEAWDRGIRPVRFWMDPANVASRRILEAVGAVPGGWQEPPFSLPSGSRMLLGWTWTPEMRAAAASSPGAC
jgi:RimJ/RimL family protein N-acetyltransferase